MKGIVNGCAIELVGIALLAVVLLLVAWGQT